MKTKFATATLAATLLSTAPLVQAEPTRFQVDDEHFSMVFEVMHIGYAPVMGMFREVKANSSMTKRPASCHLENWSSRRRAYSAITVNGMITCVTRISSTPEGTRTSPLP